MNTDAPPCSFVNGSNKMRGRAAGHAREAVPPEPIFMMKSRNSMNLSSGIDQLGSQVGVVVALLLDHLGGVRLAGGARVDLGHLGGGAAAVEAGRRVAVDPVLAADPAPLLLGVLLPHVGSLALAVEVREAAEARPAAGHELGDAAVGVARQWDVLLAVAAASAAAGVPVFLGSEVERDRPAWAATANAAAVSPLATRAEKARLIELDSLVPPLFPPRRRVQQSWGCAKPRERC